MAGSNFSIVNGADGSSKISISTPSNDINGNTVVGHLAMTQVAGIATPVSSANLLPVSDPALGTAIDTPWAGTGNASVIAALKAVYLKLAATLPVSLSGSLPTGSNVIGAVSVANLPATQPVSAASLPLPAGAATAAKQPAIGAPGTPAGDVLTVQGAPSMTALKIDGSAVTQPVSDPALGTAIDTPWAGTGNASVIAALKAVYLKLAATLPVSLSGSLPTGSNVIGAVSVANLPATQPVSAASLPLPAGAATAAKQPAIGAPGTPAGDVLTVQGASSMTALKIDGSAVTQPVSGTVSVANAPVSWRSSSAAEASRLLKPSSGTLYSVYVTAPSTGYLMLFDAASVPSDGAVTPIDVIQCASNATTVLDYTATPLSFTNGMVAVFSSTGPFVKTASPVAFIKGGCV